MAATARPRFTQPNETRAKPPFPNAVGDGRSLAKQATTMTLAQSPAANAQGDNSTPVDMYRQPNPGGQVQFAPGDPLRPIPGISDRHGFPRPFPIAVGSNIGTTVRESETVSFDVLRNIAAAFEGIQLCEQVHFRILNRLDLAFVPRPEVLGDGDDASSPKWVDGGRRIAEWFESPDRRQDLKAWMTAAYRDILEIDALGIYHHLNRGGGLYALDLLAGDYIKCLADGAGRTPQPDAPAYMQVLYGVPAQLFTTDELDYLRETARTDSLYGLSRVERILMRANLALRKGHFDLTRFTDGVTPSGVLETQNADLFRLTPDEVLLWQDMFNGALSGNDAQRVRAKAMPPGWTFKPLQNEQIATDLDRWLLNITTGVFGLSMDEIGMTETSNRAVGDAQEKAVYRNAVRPTADFFARYFTRLLRRYDGLPIAPGNAMVSRAASPTKPKGGTWDARYMASWKGMEEQEDFNAKVDVGVKLFQSGVFTKLQTRRWLQLPVEKGEQDVPAFITPQNGMDQVVVLDDIQDARALAAKARQQKIDQGDAALKQQQMIDQHMQQQGQEGQGGDEGNGQGDADEGPPEPPSGASGGASQDEDEESEGDESEGDNSDEGESGNDEAAGPDAEAEAEVDRLIAQAKQKAGKSKQQRAAMAGEDTDGYRSADASRRFAHEPDGADDGRGWDIRGQRSDAVGRADTDRDARADRDGTGSRGRAEYSSSGRTASDGSASGGRANLSASGNGTGARSGIATSERDDTRSSGVIGTTNRRTDNGTNASRGRGSAAERADEWRNWRAIALKAVRRGETVPEFVSAVLPANFHAYAADALSRAQTPDDVRQVFAEVREAETHAEECRCLVCGCGEPLNDHGMPYTVAGTAGNLPGDAPTYPITVPPIDDCYVALYLPAHVGQPLADLVGRDITEPRDLHIHLAALGREGDVDVDALCQVVQSWATSQHPIVARIPGYGRMPNTLDGSCDAATAIVESATLAPVRQDLIATLHGAGFAMQDADTFTPQIELAYFSPGSDFPEPLTHVPTNGADFTLPYVWVVAGLRRYAYPLGGDHDERAAVVDELRALRSEVTQAMAADYARYANQQPIFGAGHKIIGNIGVDGTFRPVGEGHEHTTPTHETYFVRHTMNPEYDVQRNWSGWMGHNFPTFDQAVENMAEEGLNNRHNVLDFKALGIEDAEDRAALRQEQQSGTLHLADVWNASSMEDRHAFLQHVADELGLDIRYNEAWGQWQLVHHEGLSGYPLDDVHSTAEAYADLAKHANPDRAFGWEGFGHQSMGNVRYIGTVPGSDTLHLFAADSMAPENSARMMTPSVVRWAEHEIVRGAGGKIIGNIYPDGTFVPAGEHITHADVHAALALHAPGSVKHTALANYLTQYATVPAKGIERQPLRSPEERLRDARTVPEMVAVLQGHFPQMHIALDHCTNAEAVRAVGEAMLRCAAVAPDAMRHLYFVGAADAPAAKSIVEQVYFDTNGRIGETIGGTMYITTKDGNHVSDLSSYNLQRAASFGIILSPGFLNTPDTYTAIAQEAIARGHFGTFASDTPRATFTHEFGHVIEGYLRGFAPDEQYRYYQQYRYAVPMADRPTGYSYANEHELFAESFAAWLLGDDAYQYNPHVQAVQTVIESAFPPSEATP